MKLTKHLIRTRNIILVIFLAVLCIGGVELAVCRVMDPELFARLTDPVIACVQRAVVQANDAAIELTEMLFKEEEVIPETPDPDSQFITNPAIWTDYSSMENINSLLEEEDGKAYLLGSTGNIVYYSQIDPRWAQEPYGSDTIGRYACGPVVMAMAVSSMTQEEMDPVSMSAWAVEKGHWARRSGSHLSIIEGIAADFGLQTQSEPNCTAEQLRQELAAGKLAIALVTKGHFTNGGHFILLRGVTLDGSILVSDPSSLERSLQTWDAQLILDELSYSRKDGAPLWFLSA